MRKISLLCATTALALPSMAFAQSTGSAEVEETEAIIITGSRLSNGVGGVVVPDVPKTRSILTQELIARQPEGQSILQIINLVPGVNFTNNDPYGGSGGNLRIRGFPGNRIALLWDGLPLNDTGNYAIFGNQQMDPELIDRVSVNLGTTDVDSPTPSAAGGVVSYRSIVPTEEFGTEIKGSIGTFDYFRAFALLNTGSFTSFGTRAWISGSDTEYDKFRGPGKLRKRQFNGRVYQPIGANGDFVSLAAHSNRNRNNSYNAGTAADYAANREFDNIATCVRGTPNAQRVTNDAAGSAANSNDPASCTNYFNLRINPSNTENVRGSMRFTLADGLILTADPGYQAVLANGGGTGTLAENSTQLRGSSTAGGVDLNGDGDFNDTIRVYQPSNTRTNRYTFLTSLIWEATEQHRLRVAYTYDRGQHRQTGEFGRIFQNGDPISVFGGKYNEQARILTADGKTLQNRDRYSVAQLQQLSAEYFGRFLDNRLTLTAGIRAPFFRRELNQFCFTQISNAHYCARYSTSARRLSRERTVRAVRTDGEVQPDPAVSRRLLRVRSGQRLCQLRQEFLFSLDRQPLSIGRYRRAAGKHRLVRGRATLSLEQSSGAACDLLCEVQESDRDRPGSRSGKPDLRQHAGPQRRRRAGLRSRRAGIVEPSAGIHALWLRLLHQLQAEAEHPRHRSRNCGRDFPLPAGDTGWNALHHRFRADTGCSVRRNAEVQLWRTRSR
jgi:iron complex outermembrane receptor protein